MAKTCMILGESGDGKTTSIVVPPNGEYNKEYVKGFPSSYDGIDLQSTIVINSDGKDLPFPYGKLGWKVGGNIQNSSYSNPITVETLIGNPIKRTEGLFDKINSGTKIKRIIIDTINGSMNDKEMAGGMSWDKWYDLAKDYYKLIVKANSMREDLIIYLFGHVAIYTDVNGNENKCLLTNGKKLEKIKLESKVPIVLNTLVQGSGNDNKYYFETQKNRSTSKSPVGMFDDFLIPNSLKLVDQKIREYYGLEA